MAKLLSVVVLALALFAGPTSASEVGGSQMYADVAYLSQIIGARPVGSVAGGRAADWIEQRFWSLGYDVERWEFSYDRDGQTVHGTNLIASVARPCTFVVGAHYDTKPNTVGANDNASGTAAMLDIADKARGQFSPLNVCFVAFDGEDDGVRGSYAYAEALGRDERRALRGMLSVDMVGVGDILAIKDDNLAMAERIVAAAEPLGIVTGPFWRRWRSDDTSFNDVGVSAGRITWLDDPRKHTPEDTLVWISPELLDTASRLVLAILQDVATEPDV